MCTVASPAHHTMQHAATTESGLSWHCLLALPAAFPPSPLSQPPLVSWLKLVPASDGGLLDSSSSMTVVVVAAEGGRLAVEEAAATARR